MSVIVTDEGFATAGWPPGFLSLEELKSSETGGHGVDVPGDTNPAELVDFLEQVAVFRIGFASFADGRGFSLARALRQMGYRGRIRAYGHVLADQYAMARRSGFDEVEISDDMAARQGEDQWLARSDWLEGDYRRRLGLVA